MTRNNYSRQRGASWLGFYFSRFLSSRVLRVAVFGRTYRVAWTWSFEAGRVRAEQPAVLSPDFAPLRQAMANVDRAEAV